MSPVHRIVLLGFAPFERASFESFFRLVGDRTPLYQICEDLTQCDAVLVNADSDAAVAAVSQRGRLGRALMLGSTRRPAAAQQLARPINLLLLLRALDRLVQGAPTPCSSVQRVLADMALVAAGGEPQLEAEDAVPQADPTTLSGDLHMADLGLQAQRTRLDHVLVVDDSDIALRFMVAHLSRFGFQVHLARSGAQAIERVSRRHFEFVFLEVALEGLDGFHTCKAIKRASYPDGRPAPTVVLLGTQVSEVDRLRAAMAGCDALLHRPLREAELLKVIGDREVELHAFANTAQGANTLF